MPLLTVFGWQKPCYLLGEGYAKTFTELMEGTEWEKYGVGKYEKCANCMVHCGFEGTAATDAIKHPLQDAADPDARGEDRRSDGAGYRPVKAAAGGIRLRHAMSSRRCQRSGPASPTPQRRAQRSRQRSNSAKALFEAARRCGSAPASCNGFLAATTAPVRARCRHPASSPPAPPAAAHGRHRRKSRAAPPMAAPARRQNGPRPGFPYPPPARRWHSNSAALVSRLSRIDSLPAIGP